MSTHRYIPSGYTEKKTGPDCEIYQSEPGYPAGYMAIGFSGRRTRPDFHHRFTSPEQRERFIADYLRQREEAAWRKAAERKARAAFKHTLKVGDILYASWGYDQTNIDYFEVVAVPGPKSVRLRPIGTEVQSSAAGADYVAPVPGRYLTHSSVLSDDPIPETGILKRVREGNAVTLSSFASAHPWDGKPKYETATGWGH